MLANWHLSDRDDFATFFDTLLNMVDALPG